jgi:hypothetical protein
MTDPVVIIGAGRSGTTLLSETLGAHPDFYMPAEPNFLLPKLFHAMWTTPEYVSKTKAAMLAQHSLPDWRDRPWSDFVAAVQASPGLQQEIDAQAAQERSRVVTLLRDVYVDLMMPAPLARPRWGFKEIWNGHPAHDYAWELYNVAFPDARWIHMVRDPFEFARSAAGWNNTPLDDGSLRNELRNWVLMNRRAEEQRATGRYLALRMEDLVGDHERQLARVFEFVGLAIDARCRAAIETFYVRTPEKRPLPPGDPAAVEGLPEMMAAYGYEAPARA